MLTYNQELDHWEEMRKAAIGEIETYEACAICEHRTRWLDDHVRVCRPPYREPIWLRALRWLVSP